MELEGAWWRQDKPVSALYSVQNTVCYRFSFFDFYTSTSHAIILHCIVRLNRQLLTMVSAIIDRGYLRHGDYSIDNLKNIAKASYLGLNSDPTNPRLHTARQIQTLSKPQPTAAASYFLFFTYTGWTWLREVCNTVKSFESLLTMRTLKENGVWVWGTPLFALLRWERWYARMDGKVTPSSEPADENTAKINPCSSAVLT